MPVKLKIEDVDLSQIDSRGMNQNRFGSSEYTGLQFWVYKDGRKEWHYRYKSPHGHRTSIKLGRYPNVGYAEALVRVNAEKALLKQGLDPVESRRFLKRGQIQRDAHARIISEDGFSVAVYAADFLEYVFRTKKSGTHRRYAGVVKNYVVPLFGGFDVRHFFFPAYQELLMDINAPSQRSNTHKTMRAFFSYLVDMEVVPANPLLGRKSLSSKLNMSPRRMLLEWKRANPDRVDKVFMVTSDYVITHVKNRLKKWINFTTHDLRRTVRTYLQEMGCPKEIREQIRITFNHKAWRRTTITQSSNRRNWSG